MRIRLKYIIRQSEVIVDKIFKDIRDNLKEYFKEQNIELPQRVINDLARSQWAGNTDYLWINEE